MESGGDAAFLALLAQGQLVVEPPDAHCVIVRARHDPTHVERAARNARNFAWEGFSCEGWGVRV